MLCQFGLYGYHLDGKIDVPNEIIKNNFSCHISGQLCGIKNNFLLFSLTYQLFPFKWWRQGPNWHNTKKIKDQIDTIEMLGTKLKYGVKDKGQFHNLS